MVFDDALWIGAKNRLSFFSLRRFEQITMPALVARCFRALISGGLPLFREGYVSQFKDFFYYPQVLKWTPTIPSLPNSRDDPYRDSPILRSQDKGEEQKVRGNVLLIGYLLLVIGHWSISVCPLAFIVWSLVSNLASLVSCFQSPVSSLSSLISDPQSPVSSPQSLISSLQSPVSRVQSLISSLWSLVSPLHSKRSLQRQGIGVKIWQGFGNLCPLKDI